jgi:hypothetical protein
MLMRKLISILLLTSILFNISGYYFTFLIIRQGYKRDFINHLRHDNYSEAVLVLRITDDEILSEHSSFKWMEDNEFRYQGKMYDVISSEKQGNVSVFHCLNDSKEEALMAKYEGLVKHHTDMSLPYKQKSSQLLQQIVKEAATEKRSTLLLFASFNRITPIYSFSLNTFITLPYEHPPKTFLSV